MLCSASTAAILLAGSAFAEVPRVATDIAPVHSLVARVMGDLGTPDMVIAQGASPHGYSLRPSEAAALQEADVVFWIGEDLTPWLEDAIETLAGDATVTTLLEADGVELLPFREGALFEAHDHGHDDHDADHHDEDKHDDHAHKEDDHAHDDHDHDTHDDDHGHDEEHAHEDDHDGHDDHDDHAGHDHGAHDPHAWLSPEIASIWLNTIAGTLSAADPDNAGTYFANAAAGRAELDALTTEINALLDPVRGQNFIVFHDAYQYFEATFEFPASGAISLSDASDPSPARIAEIQGRVADEGITCVLSEPQFNPNLVATVLDGSAANTAVIDPLGVDIDAGADFYPQLLRNLATSLAGCL
jgi:zinc transport system substrate-binding protein